MLLCFARITHTHTHIHPYIYIYIYRCRGCYCLPSFITVSYQRKIIFPTKFRIVSSGTTIWFRMIITGTSVDNNFLLFYHTNEINITRDHEFGTAKYFERLFHIPLPMIVSNSYKIFIVSKPSVTYLLTLLIIYYDWGSTSIFLDTWLSPHF